MLTIPINAYQELKPLVRDSTFPTKPTPLTIPINAYQELKRMRSPILNLGLGLQFLLMPIRN